MWNIQLYPSQTVKVLSSINQVSLNVKSIKTLQDVYLNLEPQVIMGLEIEERVQGCSLLYNKRLHKYYKNYISIDYILN